MAYPLTGSSLSATLVVSLPGAIIPVKINPTLSSATTPWSGVLTPFSRSAKIKVSTPGTIIPIKINPLRQWGLAAPITGITSSNWGVF